MNAADLARLEIAKRAYSAAQPSATEVQTGVRRARLSLRRVKSRRTWFGKGLVLVVLAVGSLAYAKPHALGELVENLSHTGGGGSVRRGSNGVSVASPAVSPAVSPATTTLTGVATTDVATAPSLDAPPQVIEPALHESPEPAPRTVSATTRNAASKGTSEGAAAAVKVKSAAAPAHGATSAADGAALAAAPASQAPPTPAAVSDWGRVAQALASGDETKALSALSELSESDNQRTRDKADLGRAQLFIAHGDSDKGCALVRSLSNRRAGSHIERQAQLLLKSCTR